jgi:hypothetical protein
MKIDPASAWRADLVRPDGSRVHFDTPRCALLAWKTGKVEATDAVMQEYYDRTWRSAKELRFALASDAVGPMGADLAPVDPLRAAKFAADHHAARVVGLSDVTVELLQQL